MCIVRVEVLQRSLHEKLCVRRKRVLLVLDDVWNEEKRLWESLRNPFYGAEMIRIIVTTRNTSVAAIMQTTTDGAHHLGYLPEEQCLKLFMRLAFSGRNPKQFPSLKAIGEKIVKKCGGLPLAVKSLGGLLQHEDIWNDEDRWNAVLHSELWDEETDILPALKLSYIRMPSHLKPCFQICSMFPKDYKIMKGELVKLWAAHGYIQHNAGKSTVEEMGYKYFDELHRRSFFDDWRPYFDYRSDEYKMHDNIHDLARYVPKDRDLKEYSKHKIRHLYIHNESLDSYLDDIGGALRTLMILLQEHDKSINDVLGRSIRRLTHSRYLNVALRPPCAEFLLPEGTGNLICLRHLKLDIGANVKLPRSIADLYNLAVLELSCQGLVELPETLRNLVSLTTIHFSGFRNYQLPALGELPSLRSLVLSDFPNVKSIGNEFYRGRNNCHHPAFPSLTSLIFRLLPRWEKWDELQEGDFPRLQKLQIKHCRILSSLPSLQNLSFLSHISLEGCASFLLWLASSFPPNLRTFENSGNLRLRLPRGFRELKKLERLSGIFWVRIDDLFRILNNLVSLNYLTLWNADITEACMGAYEDVKLFREAKEALRLVVERDHDKVCHRNSCDSEDASFSLLTNLLPETLINHVSLTTIYFSGFDIDQLPAFGQLPSLKSLTLMKFDNVKSIGNEFCRGGNNRHCVAFPSLTSLVFQELSNWEKWDELLEGDFPQLQKLEINQCRRLSSLPSFRNLRLLWHMRLKICDSLCLSPQSSFPPNIKTLENFRKCELHLPQGFGELKQLERLSGIFEVKIEYIVGILKNLVSLKHLIVSELWNVHRAWNGWERLRECGGIEKLVLNWSFAFKLHQLHEDAIRFGREEVLHFVVESDSEEEDEDDDFLPDDTFIRLPPDQSKAVKESSFVFEKLQPHTNLEELYIIGYCGVGYPSWIGHPSFDRLNEVHLRGCKVDQLPTLGQLPSLKFLYLQWIYGLKAIGDEFCRGSINNGQSHDVVAFPTLVTLQFQDMYDWEEWDGVRQGDFPKLEALSLHGCPRLSQLQVLPNLSMSFDLSVYQCPMIHFAAESFPPNLRTLNIEPTICLSPGAKLRELESLKGVFRARNEELFGILNSLPANTRVMTVAALRKIRSIVGAEEANLKSQQGLELLRLKWSADVTDRDRYNSLCLVVEDDDDNDDERINRTDSNVSFIVLEKLQPHENLRELHITGYVGVRYPSWIGHPSFNSLAKIDLHSCSNGQLPTLGQLPSLHRLALCSISGLKRIGHELCRDTTTNDGDENVKVAFPCLRFLSFDAMRDWEGWCGVLDKDFPRLICLKIGDCPRLRRDLISLPKRLQEFIHMDGLREAICSIVPTILI